uniref:Uncharacterized protein n=1 Tax=Daphnia galeata TaxID=27404 RepID=A0A8J2RNM7_9CRUS|nr:unnamed protein product [Daphnia galeata]
MPFRQFYSSRRERIITSHRRIVLSLVDPSCDFLRSSPNDYTLEREAVEFLFTETFLELMRKKATQDIKLANSAAARAKTKAGRKRETSHPDSSTQELRPRRRDHTLIQMTGRIKRVLHPTATKSWLSGENRQSIR